MKRIFAILCAMVCLFALAVPALAAPDTITITAQAPADWDELFIHIWGGPDGGDLTTWPGEPMTKGADGRFTITVSSGFTGVLVHNNQGTQCGDLSMSGTENVWIVYDGTNATIHPSDPGIKDLGSVAPPADTPAGPLLPTDKLVTVYAYIVPENVSPRLWAWKDADTDVNAFELWPGQAFTKSGDWWSIQMSAEANAIIVNNGSDKQTGDTTVEAGKDLWAVVQYDWSVEIFYSEPNLKDIIKEAPPISENPLFSRPTLGNTEPKVTYGEDDEPTTESTAPSTTKAADKADEAEEGISKKTQAIIVIATAVVAIVAIAFVLSIPKKLK